MWRWSKEAISLAEHKDMGIILFLAELFKKVMCHFQNDKTNHWDCFMKALKKQKKNWLLQLALENEACFVAMRLF